MFKWGRGMSLKSKIISSFAGFIIGSNTFERIKAVVLRQEDKNMTGEEKRQAVVSEISVIGMGIATWMLNLAIELAVTYFRSLETKYK